MQRVVRPDTYVLYLGDRLFTIYVQDIVHITVLYASCNVRMCTRTQIDTPQTDKQELTNKHTHTHTYPN